VLTLVKVAAPVMNPERLMSMFAICGQFGNVAKLPPQSSAVNWPVATAGKSETVGIPKTEKPP
jgi:hypothetical protein